MLSLVVLTLVCVITYSFEIVFGLAGTILMLLAMSVFYETKTLVIYSTLPQIMVGTIGLARSPRTVSLRYLAGMLAFAALGAAAGLAVFYALPETVFRTVLGAAITLAGAYLVIAPGRLKLNAAAMRLLDTLAGASQALFGISGPIAMTRLMGTFRGKLVVRNYALAFFLALNVLRAGAYAVNGDVTEAIAVMMAVTAPFLAVALWFSNQLHFKLNEALFRRVVAWMILLGGVTLLAR
jgi:uncharacterized membrane protein YfcA